MSLDPTLDYAVHRGDRVAICLTVASATGARPLVTLTGTVDTVTDTAVVLASGDSNGLRVGPRVIPFTAIAIIEHQPAQHPGL